MNIRLLLFLIKIHHIFIVIFLIDSKETESHKGYSNCSLQCLPTRWRCLISYYLASFLKERSVWTDSSSSSSTTLLSPSLKTFNIALKAESSLPEMRPYSTLHLMYHDYQYHPSCLNSLTTAISQIILIYKRQPDHHSHYHHHRHHRTIGQNQLFFWHLIIHFPTSSGVYERASKRPNERSVVHEQSELGRASEWVRDASEWADGWASGPVLTSRFMAVLNHNAPPASPLPLETCR